MADPTEEDPILHPHTGSWEYHVDDCRCTEADLYCNRDGWIWSCCGSCKEHSDCTSDRKHPTHWSHPRVSATISGFENNWPKHKSNKEIRAAAPESFPELDDRTEDISG